MTTLRTLTAKCARALGSVLAVLLALAPASFAQRQPVEATSVRAGGGAAEIIAEAVPDNPEPAQGDTIELAVNIDTQNLQGADSRLAAYQARLLWDPTVLQFLEALPGDPPWDKPNLSTGMAPNGRIDWNAFMAGGVVPGAYNLLKVRFRVIGAANTTTQINLSFSELVTNIGRSLLSLLQN